MMTKDGGGPWDDDDQGNEESTRQQPKQPNPWGKGGQKSSGASIVDDIKQEMQKRLKDVLNTNARKGGGGGGRGSSNGPSLSGNTWVFKVAALGLVGFWLSTGFYRVQEGELGVVLRFGRSIDLTQAGWHYRFPAPIDHVIIQKVASVNAINSRTTTDALSTGENGEGEATLILTGDENMVHTSYTVLWKIKDVNEFLFTTRNPEETIRVAAESVVREVIGQSTAKAALTEGREGIGARAQEILQGLMDQYKMGVQIVSIQLQSVAPPGPVVEAFNDVQASLVDADRSRNEAKAYESDIIPRAEGQAIQILNDAEAYNQQMVAVAEGESLKFNQVLEGYRANPGVFMRRQHILTLEHILSKTDKVIFDGKIGQGLLPHMPLPALLHPKGVDESKEIKK